MNVQELTHEGVPPEFFFVFSFDSTILHGDVLFHEAFKADGQQGASADYWQPQLSFILNTSQLLFTFPTFPKSETSITYSSLLSNDKFYQLKLMNDSWKVAISTGNLYLFLESEKFR